MPDADPERRHDPASPWTLGAVCVASPMVSAGTLADRFGRRHIERVRERRTFELAPLREPAHGVA